MANESIPLVTDFKQIFPSAVRAASSTVSNNYLTARKMTEWNLTKLIRNLADNNDGSFVISNSASNISPTNPFEFCVHGYYFSYTGTLTNNSNNYAHIKLSQSEDSDNSYSELKDIVIDTSSASPWILSTGEVHVYLQLTDDDGDIPPASKIKFKTTSINTAGIFNEITIIDGNKNP